MLGELIDLSLGVAPADLSAAASTGLRVSLAETEGVTIVFIKGAGTAADDPELTLKQHTAATAGDTTDLAVITEYYLKAEATLDGDETWTRVTQSASATIDDPGAAGTSAESQQIVAINVRPEQLTPGNRYVSLNIGDVGTNAQLGTVLYILYPQDHAAPTTFPAPLR